MSFKEKNHLSQYSKIRTDDFTGDNDISLNITPLPISGAEKKNTS